MDTKSKFAEHLRFGRKLRTPDKEAAQKMVEHFNAQKDLYTNCRACGDRLKGTLEQIKAHVCGTGN